MSFRPLLGHCKAESMAGSVLPWHGLYKIGAGIVSDPVL